MTNALQALAQVVTAPVVAQVKSKPAAKTTQSKPAQKKAAAKPAATPIKYGIHDGSRPGAGRLLFAFTHAWLSLSGLASGKSYSKAQAVQVAGATAIAYHTGNNNLSCKDGMLTLTAKGKAFFAARSNEAATVDAFVTMLKTGKPVDATGIKNADCLKAVKA